MKKYVFESLKFFCAAILCTILSAFTSPSWGACNLFHIEPQTLNGVTLTMRDDGAYVLNGTCNYNGNFLLGPQSLGAGTYTLALIDRELAPDMAGTQVQAYSQSDIGTNMVVKMDSGENYVTRTFDTDYNDVLFRIRIQEGITYDNYVIKPMFVKGATVPTEYTPYNPLCATCDGTIVNYVSATGTVSQAGTPTPENPIEPVFYKQGDMILRKVGDIADSYDASTGKITRRVRELILTGNETWMVTDPGNSSARIHMTLPVAGTAFDNTISSHFETIVYSNTVVPSRPIIRFRADQPTAIYVYMTDISMTIEQFKQWLADQYANGTPVTIYYPLAEETTEDWPASYCETPIKIATTKYNESAFSPLNTALQNAISVVDTVVSNTITQAGRIATLQTQKQTRPADDTCPAYKQCLLVEDENGTPHWYEITDPFRDFVAPIIANNVNGSSRNSSPGVPSAYTQLEYIKSTGTQYIDTGIIAKQPFDTRLGVSFADNNKRYLFGISNNSPGYCGRRDNGRFEMNNIFTSMLCKTDEKYELHYYTTSNGTFFEIKGPDNETETLEVGTIASAADSTISWKIMNNMDAYTLNGNIYYAQISQSGTLLFNGIPVRRNSDGAIGMYDTVSGEFFENKGTGSFIAGPVVPNSPSSWSVSWAADANKGISAGTVSGTSACNSISGAALEIATDTQTSSANWNAGGVDCWCQVTGVENDGEYTSIETSWIFDSVRSSALNCDTTCARSCSGSVMNTATYRNKLFGM